jgi:predicted nucleotidyltransferase component of viral defense system
MIDDNEIEAKADEFKLRPIEVEKDYVYGWLLKALFARPVLASQLVLKGGNALRKGYLADTRFSKDLDFSALGELPKPLLETELKEVCSFVEARTRVRFLDRTVIREKDLPIPNTNALEARLYFKGFYGEENLSLRTQLDITQFDKIYLPIQTRALLHPYSDEAACAATIRCHKIEEILASKLTTLLHRCKPVDLFDLLFTIILRSEFGIVRREVITTFLKKSIFGQNPNDAREQLLAVPLDPFAAQWASITAPTASLFAFDVVVANFAVLITSLFALLTPVPAAAYGGGGGFRAPRLGRGGVVRPAPAFGSGYFPSDARHTIISSGRNETMIALLYDGFERLVEPYAFEYYIRKSDGRGLEYFWGYDTTGGKSGKPGIKQFICDKIQAVRATNRQFAPRFQIQL